MPVEKPASICKRYAASANMHACIKECKLWQTSLQACAETHTQVVGIQGALPQPIRLPTIDVPQRAAQALFLYTLQEKTSSPASITQMKNEPPLCYLLLFQPTVNQSEQQIPRNYFVWNVRAWSSMTRWFVYSSNIGSTEGECSLHWGIHLGLCHPIHNKGFTDNPTDRKTAWEWLCCPSNLYLVCHDQYCRNPPHY